MIQSAVKANLRLIDLLYPKTFSSTSSPVSVSTTALRSGPHKPSTISPALSRFKALCSLYQSVVLNIFAYSSSSVPYLTLAYSFVPSLVAALGKGCIRYVSDTLPTILTALGGMAQSRALSSIFSKETVGMYLAALEALRSIVIECAGMGRMEKWRGLILGGIATLWCNLAETDQGKRVSERHRKDLQEGMSKVVSALLEDGGMEAKKDVERIRALDPNLFGGLVMV